MPGQFDRESWPATKELFAAKFREKSREEWTAIFESVDACVTPVLTPREAARHHYNTARDVFAVEGDIQPRPAPRFSKTPGSIGRSPGKAGSGTREGLLGWGIDERRQKELRAEGAFG